MPAAKRRRHAPPRRTKNVGSEQILFAVLTSQSIALMGDAFGGILNISWDELSTPLPPLTCSPRSGARR
jgi:hypothetical protein